MLLKNLSCKWLNGSIGGLSKIIQMTGLILRAILCYLLCGFDLIRRPNFAGLSINSSIALS